jgi:hypothetical protein
MPSAAEGSVIGSEAGENTWDNSPGSLPSARPSAGWGGTGRQGLSMYFPLSFNGELLHGAESFG